MEQKKEIEQKIRYADASDMVSLACRIQSITTEMNYQGYELTIVTSTCNEGKSYMSSFAILVFKK